MADYDPKRPRQIALDDDVAQVDALLGEPESSGSTGAGPDGPDHPQELGSPASGEPVEVFPEPVVIVDDPSVDDSSTGTGGPVSGSDVPVAPPPVEGTANRAVLGALATAAVAAVVAFVLVRRRRRADVS